MNVSDIGYVAGNISSLVKSTYITTKVVYMIIDWAPKIEGNLRVGMDCIR
jgi:hypothetical protein